MPTRLLEPPKGNRTPPPASGRYRFTREQYHRLGELGFFEGKRVELLRGEIITMSPMNWPHTLAKHNTAEILREVFRDRGWVHEQSPLATEDSEPEPDVAVYRGRSKDYSDHPTPADAWLIVEIAASSLAKDTTDKADFYAEVEVPEYWVVNVENRKLLVFRDPTPDGYTTKLTFQEKESVAPLAASTAIIRVADLLP